MNPSNIKQMHGKTGFLFLVLLNFFVMYFIFCSEVSMIFIRDLEFCRMSSNQGNILSESVNILLFWACCPLDSVFCEGSHPGL